MPSAEIRDLDVLLPQPIKVRLDGKVWTVPGDLPAPTYLRLRQLAAEGDVDDDEEAQLAVMAELYDMLLDLFRVHQPDLVELPMGVAQLVRAVGVIYGDAPADPPTKRQPTPRSPRKPPRPSSTPSPS